MFCIHKIFRGKDLYYDTASGTFHDGQNGDPTVFVCKEEARILAEHLTNSGIPCDVTNCPFLMG